MKHADKAMLPPGGLPMYFDEGLPVCLGDTPLSEELQAIDPRQTIPLQHTITLLSKTPLSDIPSSAGSSTTRPFSIDSHVWVILLSAMISGTVNLSILLLQEDRSYIHPYIRLWAISVWPAILGTILSSWEACSRARREWKGYGEVEQARFFRGIWWWWVMWSVVALLAVRLGYFERGGG